MKHRRRRRVRKRTSDAGRHRAGDSDRLRFDRRAREARRIIHKDAATGSVDVGAAKARNKTRVHKVDATGVGRLHLGDGGGCYRHAAWRVEEPQKPGRRLRHLDADVDGAVVALIRSVCYCRRVVNLDEYACTRQKVVDHGIILRGRLRIGLIRTAVRNELLSAGHGRGVHGGLHAHLLIVNVRYVDRNRADPHQHHQTNTNKGQHLPALSHVFVQPMYLLGKIWITAMLLFRSKRSPPRC